MIAWLLVSASGALLFLLALWQPRQDLLRPRFGVPALPVAQGTFDVELRTALPWTFGPGEAPRPLDAEGRPLALLATRWHFNRVRLTYRAAEVPELAVHPLKLGRQVRMVHATDFPVPGDEGRLQQFVQEMQLLGPDLILASGDLLHITTEAWYQQVLGALRATGIPVVAIPGNHERGNWPRRLRHLGSCTEFKVDAGPFAIIGVDTFHGRNALTPTQLRNLEARLAEARREGRSILMLAHHPVWPAGVDGPGEGHGSGGNIQVNQRRVVELCRKYEVEAVLSGHWHQDAAFDQEGRLRDDRADFPGTKFLTTTSLGHLERLVTRWPHKHNGYRVLDFEDGKLVRWSEDPEGKGRPAPIWSQSLGRIIREDHRDGQGRWTGTTVTNQTDHALRGRLSLETGSGTFTCQLDVPARSTRTLRPQEAP